MKDKDDQFVEMASKIRPGILTVADITKEAKRLNSIDNSDTLAAVLADRGKTHGDFRDHARIAQRLKVVMRDELGWGVLTDMQREALEMIQHKIARMLAGNADFAEHWLDVEGYARITRERLGDKEPEGHAGG